MIVLKIIGIVLAVIVLLIALILALRVKVMIGYSPENKFRFRIKILCFTFGGKKKKKKDKKPSRVSLWIKKKLGTEPPEESEEDKQKKSISDKVTKVVTFVTIFVDEFKWLFSKMRLDKLKIFAVCSGGDASDAAMDYGLVCATVYPLIAYITGNVNTKKNAEEVQIGCDFDGNGYFEFDIHISIRTIHLLRAAIRALGDLADVAESYNTEEAKQ